MTSSKPSDSETSRPSDRPISATADEICEKCSGPMRLRNARPYPVLLQVLFGVSFAAFLWASTSNRLSPRISYAWTAIEVVLGILLVRARSASAKKVFICLRCGATLR
jgi:hypothetical protein